VTTTLANVSGETEELARSVSGDRGCGDEYPPGACNPYGFAAPEGALSMMAEISMHVVASNTATKRCSVSPGDRGVNQLSVDISVSLR
jgi:hypothetical protein